LAGPGLVILVYRFLPPPVTPLMLIRAAEGEEIDYRWTALENISPHLARAVIASEDTRFCVHWGIDLKEVQNTLEEWRDGERLRGASTISMQTVKNVMLWPQRHIVRKLVEAWLTPQMELIWSKARILEVYLNVVEMAPGIYGAEAAAQRYFGKPAQALTEREATLLAAALSNPRVMSPAQPTPFLVEQAAVIRGRMDQLGPLRGCVF
jgi:monofunctional biosynthetic peptidoglycan transglycosylase